MNTAHRIVQGTKWVVACVLWALGVLAWLRRRRARRGEVSILLFHRIAGTEAARLPLAVPPNSFRALVRDLARRYDVVTWSAARSARPSARARAVITFDDGYADNADIAWPILQEAGVPALFCLTTAFVSGERPMWWDVVAAAKGASSARTPSGEVTFGDETEARIASLKEMPNAERVAAIDALRSRVSAEAASTIPAALSWSDAIGMREAGAEFGGHTVTHPILPRCASAEVTRELVDCHRALSVALDESAAVATTAGPTETPRTSYAFAYPNGDHDARVRNAVREAGFDSAFTIEKGPHRADTDPYRVPRLNVHEPKYSPDGERFSWALFEAEMLGVFDVLLARKRRR